MSARMRYNFSFLRGLMTDPAVQRVVQREADAIEARAQALGSQTRGDHQVGSSRYRAAVIAGYEPGATADRTRDVLLRSLDG